MFLHPRDPSTLGIPSLMGAVPEAYPAGGRAETPERAHSSSVAGLAALLVLGNSCRAPDGENKPSKDFYRYEQATSGSQRFDHICERL